MTRDQAIEIARREALRSREGHSYLPVNADTWMPHEWVIDAILAASEVGPTEVDLWAEIHRLRAAVKGPEGFASWQQAATAERGRRARYERELRNISEAQRFDRSAFEDDGSFAAWAQNRARHALDDAWPDKPPHDVPCECAHVGPDYCPRHTP